jgi:hypothetical protein
VICLAGGGFAVDADDRSGKSSVKIVVYDNGKLGFVDIERSSRLAAGLHGPEDPDFGDLASSRLGTQRLEAGELGSVRTGSPNPVQPCCK